MWAHCALKTARVPRMALSTAMERLSTGKRIDSAKDDAAGLAIASRMNAEVRGMNVAIRNANDGISLAQTAEGALGEINNMLQRMRELAVQSGNGTNSSSDRAALQAELAQLVAEVDAVSETTAFNGVKLLDGASSDISLQIGTRAMDTLSFAIEAFDSNTLGLSGYAVDGQLTTGRTGTTLTALAVDDVQINGKAAFAIAPVANTAGGLADAINTNTGSTGVKATAYNLLTGALPNATTFAAGMLQINGTTVGAAGSVEELVANINRDASGVIAALNDDGTVTLSNNTGANMVVSGTAPTDAGFTTGVYRGFVAITSVSGDPITIAAKNAANGYPGGAGTLADVKQFGLNETGDGSNFVGSAVTSGLANVLASTDDLKVNGVVIGKSDTGSAASKAAAINKVSAETGVIASAKTEVKVAFNFSGTSNATATTINGVPINLTAATTLADVVTAINSTGLGSVVASSDDAGNLILTASDGSDIIVADSGGTPKFGTPTTLAGESGAGAIAAGITFGGRISLTSPTGADIRVEGSSATLTKVGLAVQGGASGMLAGAMSIATVNGARAAMEQIDHAIDKVSSARGNLGAVQNRLETRVNVLTSSGDQHHRSAVAHRGCRFLRRNNEAREVADPQPGRDGNARPGEPEPARRAEAAAVSKPRSQAMENPRRHKVPGVF